MSVTTRDVVIWTAAMLAFPLAVNITSIAASDGAPDRDPRSFDPGASVEQQVGEGLGSR